MGVIDRRVAVITGGARGIGASISRLFAQEGASLVINDLGGAADGSGGIRRDRMIFNLAEEDWDAVIRVYLKGRYSTVNGLPRSLFSSQLGNG
jgi:hypothetical protein